MAFTYAASHRSATPIVAAICAPDGSDNVNLRLRPLTHFACNLSSVLISVLLCGFIMVAHELGLRWGNYRLIHADSDTKSQSLAIQGGLLGVFALILGFTFSMSIQCYDERSGAESSEANSSGTAELRTALQPAPSMLRRKPPLTHTSSCGCAVPGLTLLTETNARP